MAYVTSLFARRMIQAAGSSVDSREMLRSIGLDPDGAPDVAQMIAADAYYEMLERIADVMPNAHELPLRVGPMMQADDYGALGLAMKTAPTVRKTLERVARYARLWTDNMAYELRAEEGGALFVLHRHGERRLGMRLSNEATMSSATSLIRQLSSARFRPRAAYLKHAAPEITSAHEQYFGCPVRFGATEDAISISDASLDMPNHQADDGLSRFLISHLDSEIKNVEADDSFATQVRNAISRALSEGVPKMAEIGKRLGMSERTLQRRLSEEDLSFKPLVEDSRRQLAENLLSQSQYSISEIGFLTGFSEQSAFTRAFRRWTDQTPAAYRKATQQRAS